MRSWRLPLVVALVGVLSPAPALPASRHAVGQAGAAAAASAGLPAPRARWSWPLAPTPPVARAFEAPSSPYGAGHRGVDLATRVGAEVTAVAAGTVTHAGVVSGRGTVSVLHADGVRSTYEPVAPTVAEGVRVEPGTVLGALEATPGHCAPASCLHLGAVRGRTYLDPMTFLTVPRIVLLPPLRMAR